MLMQQLEAMQRWEHESAQGTKCLGGGGWLAIGTRHPWRGTCVALTRVNVGGGGGSLGGGGGLGEKSGDGLRRENLLS